MKNGPIESNWKELKKLAIPKEQVEANTYHKSELFEVRLGKETQGPFFVTDLKNFVKEHDMNTEMEVRCLINKDWVILYHHPLFQRRRPQLLSEDVFAPGDHHILMDGLKTGPFGIDDVKKLVAQKKVCVTDQISVDGGETWVRLYQLPGFDRRNINNEQLPHLPEWEVFKQSNAEVTKVLSEMSEEQKQTEAIAGLAYIENVKSGKAIGTDEILEPEPAAEEKEPQAPAATVHELPTPAYTDTDFMDSIRDNFSSLWAKVQGKWLYPSIFAVSVIGLLMVFLTTSQEKPAGREIASQKPTATKTYTPPKAAAQQTKTYNPPQRKFSKGFRSRKESVRKTPTNKSFSESRAFKDRLDNVRKKAQQKDESDDGYYYDEGDDPVELDPVRAGLDKETIDPATLPAVGEAGPIPEDVDFGKMKERSPAAQKNAWPDPDAIEEDQEPFDQEAEL